MCLDVITSYDGNNQYHNTSIRHTLKILWYDKDILYLPAVL
jgi:hypothetical protein